MSPQAAQRQNRRYAGVFGLKQIFLHCFEIEVPGIVVVVVVVDVVVVS